MSIGGFGRSALGTFVSAAGGHEGKEPMATAAEQRRDECGLTTLAWLVIVAAVAGLAVLAALLSWDELEDRASGIVEKPRSAAAEAAGADITRQARLELSEAAAGNTADSVAVVNGHYGPKCARLSITYWSLDLAFTWHNALPGKSRPFGNANESACIVTKSPR